MGSNDSIVLEKILDERLKNEGMDKGSAFDKFAFQQILKDYALTDSQLEDGWVDGEGDGGIDGFFVLVNGYPYDGNDGFQWPRENPHITVWVITCKSREGFQEPPLASMYMTLCEFWNCALANPNLKGHYSEDLLQARGVFLKAYNTLAHLDPLVEIHLVFASLGDAASVADPIRRRMAQLEQQAREQFSKSEVTGEFIGARELLRQYRKIKDERLVLPFASSLSHDENNYVVIAELKDYYAFVQNEESKLRRYLFDSNVRDFLGYNSVNEDIDDTLKNPSAANFWWLNNGITILADNAHIIGKKLHLQGVQIVNGLQTTETMYRHFASGRQESLDMDILIKVITSQDVSVRTRIIQATNNQSNVASHSLHATDDIQRNIEYMLGREKIYYQRRDHYYKNEGMPAERFITPLELAKGYLSVVFQNPAAASKLRNRFMKNETSYHAVFDPSFPLDGWPLIAAVWLAAGRVFWTRAEKTAYNQKLCHCWTPLVVYCVVASLAGKFDYDIKCLRKIKWTDESDVVVGKMWGLVESHFGGSRFAGRRRLSNPRAAYDTVLLELATKTGMSGVACANQRPLPTIGKIARMGGIGTMGLNLTEELLEAVRQTLPKQPWPVGIHNRIGNELGLKPRLVHEAIDTLIARGVFNEQKDGIVFDGNGRAILVDNRRCDKTLGEINANLANFHK